MKIVKYGRYLKWYNELICTYNNNYYYLKAYPYRPLTDIQILKHNEQGQPLSGYNEYLRPQRNDAYAFNIYGILRKPFQTNKELYKKLLGKEIYDIVDEHYHYKQYQWSCSDIYIEVKEYVIIVSIGPYWVIYQCQGTEFHDNIVQSDQIGRACGIGRCDEYVNKFVICPDSGITEDQ